MDILVPKKIRIANLKLRVLYNVLMLATVILCVCNLVKSKGFTTTVPNYPRLSVQPSVSTLEAIRTYPQEEHGVCPTDEWHQWNYSEVAPFTHYYVKMRCRSACIDETDDDCVDPSATVLMPSPEELSLEIEIEEQSFGPNVTVPLSNTPLKTYQSVVTKHAMPVAQAYVLAFKYEYMAKVPNRLESGSEKNAVTVILDRRGLPWKRFQPRDASNEIFINASSLVHVAKGGFHPNLRFQEVARRYIVNQTNGSFSAFPSLLFSMGITLSVEVNCYTDDHDLHVAGGGAAEVPHDSSIWNLGASIDTPVCLLQAEARDSLALEIRQPVKSDGKTTRYFAKLVRVTCKMGSSFHRVNSINAILVFITSSFVLLRLPSTVLQFIVQRLLGRLSKIYRAATVQQCPFRRFCAQTILQIATHSWIFSSLADMTGPRGVSKEQLLEHLQAAMRESSELEDAEIAIMADFAMGHMPETQQHPHSQQDANEIINVASFCRAISSDSTSVSNIGFLFDRKCQPSLPERLFAPSGFWRQAHNLPTAKTQLRECGAEEQTSPREPNSTLGDENADVSSEGTHHEALFRLERRLLQLEAQLHQEQGLRTELCSRIAQECSNRHASEEMIVSELRTVVGTAVAAARDAALEITQQRQLQQADSLPNLETHKPQKTHEPQKNWMDTSNRLKVLEETPRRVNESSADSLVRMAGQEIHTELANAEHLEKEYVQQTGSNAITPPKMHRRLAAHQAHHDADDDDDDDAQENAYKVILKQYLWDIFDRLTNLEAQVSGSSRRLDVQHPHGRLAVGSSSASEATL